jgi:hypothetical protein
MSLTTDPNDPELGHGIDTGKVPQNKKYLVLSEDELAKGFVRPVRGKYIHVGKKIERHEDGRLYGKLILIDDLDYPINDSYTHETGYGGYIKYPDDHPGSAIGKYITIFEVKAIQSRKVYFGGCEGETSMGKSLAETYARDPKFYGATYCVHCSKHLPVKEFIWSNTNEIVGS